MFANNHQPIKDNIAAHSRLRHPSLLDFVGDALANILNLTDPDQRRERVLIVPPMRQPHMSKEMMALINHMGRAPKGQGTRFDSPSRLRAIFFLLKSAQCRLCARGAEHEDLLFSYLSSRSSFGLIGNSITKAEEKHRKKFRGFDFLATAGGARTFVTEILAESFGPALLTTSTSADAAIAQVRNTSLPADERYNQITNERLVFDFFSGFFDFRFHSDKQILDTLTAVESGARRSDRSQTFAALAELITFSDDIRQALDSYLPPHLWM